MPPILVAVDKPFARGLMWFRRDLRVQDNAALYHALRGCREVVCAFVFDRAILDALPRRDRRVEFIQESVLQLQAALRSMGGDLVVRHAVAEEEIAPLARQLEVQAVFANRDDEPAALDRDAQVLGALANAGVSFQTFKDHVVFERDEVLTQAGGVYSVFTPYKRAWMAKAEDAFYLSPYPVERHADALIPTPAEHRTEVPALADLGFEPTNLHELGLGGGMAGARQLFDEFVGRIDRYDSTRDFPAVRGPSYLGVHLRFGTLSIREAAATAHALAGNGSRGAATWLGELIWRDFYAQVMAHRPDLAEGKSYKPEYDRIRWHHGKHADQLFAAWCEGRTGYPLVDAGMRQLVQSGYMHNRLRMVTASFLCKDLGLDWRRGEAFFAEHLNDFEFASNNGGWQWASSSGCDAQPYFRIFNPVTQSERFDPDGKFIRRYVPELARLSNKMIHAPWLAKPVELEAAGLRIGQDYPAPVVDHGEARQQTLERYAVARESAERAA